MRGYVAHVISEHVRFSHHRNALSGGRLSEHTISLHGRVLRAFAASLVQEGRTEGHILARFKPLRPETKEIVPLTADEFRRFVAALTGSEILRACDALSPV